MPSGRDVLQVVPACSERRIALRVSPDAERMVRAGHPWLYDEAILKQSHAGAPGDLAVVYDRRERFLAIGLYDPTSPIRVRVLQRHKPAPIDRTWFTARLAAALAVRRPLAAQRDTTGYRLVHGENDGLPGLVVDRYEQTLVVKLYTAAWAPYLQSVLAALEQTVPSERVILRLSRAVQGQRKSLHGLADGMVLLGRPLKGPVPFVEHGLRFEADVLHGNKTGFFLDQRDNRAEVERHSRRQHALDVFASSGAFSVYAARGGAREVTTVDMSRPALEAAKRQMALNRAFPAVARAKHRLIAGDGFEVLDALAKSRERFGLVIVNPPAFATTTAEAPTALSAYRRLTQLALRVLEPEGLLVFSCCSSQVSGEQFFMAVHQAAAKAGRPLRDLMRTGHPLDHPIGFKEGAYLKTVFALAP